MAGTNSARAGKKKTAGGKKNAFTADLPEERPPGDAQLVEMRKNLAYGK